MAKKALSKKKDAKNKAKPRQGGRPPKGDAKLVTAATRVSLRVRKLLEEKASKTSQKLGRKIKLSQYLRLLCRKDVRDMDDLPLSRKKDNKPASHQASQQDEKI